MKPSIPRSRRSEIARMRAVLESNHWPRLQMSVIVLVTGVVGLVASFLLRWAGLEAMVLRYPLAILIAYAIFLLQLWAWIRWRTDATHDLLDGVGDAATEPPGWSGGGGTSGGGGSSASWGPSSTSSSGSASDASVLDGVDADLPLLGILALVAVALVSVLAAGWIVWTAPALMAELLVDAAIAGGLYRRMRRAHAHGWLWPSVRHTAWPLAGLVVFFAALGGVLQHFAPEATSLMEAVRAI